MDLIKYINWNNYSLLNQDIINKFIICNNRNYRIEIFGDICTYLDYYECDILRYFDILDEITIIIKNNDDEIINIDDILNINLIIVNYKIFILKINDYNIFYQDKKLIIINFNLKNFVNFDNNEIGGIPLFLFDNNCVKIIINFKKNMFNYDEKKIHIYIGGFMIFSSFIKHTNITLEKEILNLIPKLSSNDKKEVINKLNFYDPNDTDYYQLKKYSNSKLFNYLNLILYNKNILNNKIIYNLELEQETTHLVFTVNYEIIDKINFCIRSDDYDIFDCDIFALYYEGYFIFKLISKILSCSKIKLLIGTNANIRIQEIDDKIEIKIFNVIDMFN